MTDKLPEWVEKWVEDNELFGCIDAGLVRAFLAKFVLCDKHPVAYVCYGDPDSFSAFSWRDVKCDCGEPRVPMYGPIKGAPE